MKNIKRYLVALLVVTILVASIGLYACNNDDDIQPCTLTLTQFYTKNQNPFLTDYFDVESKLNFTEKINSVEELKAFCQERQFQVFDEENKKFNYDRVSKKLREYDEEFFKKRSIVLMFRLKETIDFYGYASANIEDGVMTINLATANGNNTTAERTQIRIWEINKKVAKEINQIKVEERIGELDQKVDIKIYEDDNIYFKTDAPLDYILKSYEELNNFCNEETSPFFHKNDVTIQDIVPEEFLTEELLNDEEFLSLFDKIYNNKNKKIIEILNKYDEEFFKTKSLVLVFRHRGNNNFYSVKSCNLNGNSLDITLSTPKLDSIYIPIPEDLTCVYLFEMDKEQIVNVNQINVNEIEE